MRLEFQEADRLYGPILEPNSDNNTLGEFLTDNFKIPDDNLNEISKTLDSLLAQADLSSTTSEGRSKELPDGYYLSEVEEAKLGDSSNGNPMVTIKFRIVEDGLKSVIDEAGNDILVPAQNTKGNTIYVNYVLTNNLNLGFFVSDMLKFENPSERPASI